MQRYSYNADNIVRCWLVIKQRIDNTLVTIFE